MEGACSVVVANFSESAMGIQEGAVVADVRLLDSTNWKFLSQRMLDPEPILLSNSASKGLAAIMVMICSRTGCSN